MPTRRNQGWNNPSGLSSNPRTTALAEWSVALGLVRHGGVAQGGGGSAAVPSLAGEAAR